MLRNKQSFVSKLVWDSPQTPEFATVDLTSTVTAGNVPMVTVKMKHTDKAITQIWLESTRPTGDQRWLLFAQKSNILWREVLAVDG